MLGRALLIAAEKYGEGFVDLPATAQDIVLVKAALESRGFFVNVAPHETVANASLLENAISTFCESVRDDVGIVYFSGHGVAVDDMDWIVPAGVSRNAALRSATQRVSTDLSALVPDGDGLVIFLIDACREKGDDSSGKGGRPWGNGKQEYGDKRFIRIFGCAEKELCHVWRGGHEGKDVSVFTAALGRALGSDSTVETVQDLLTITEKQCGVIAKTANPKLPVQRPSIGGFGDINSATFDQLTGQRIFSRVVTTPGVAEVMPWETFDPRRLHCLIVESEHSAFDTDSEPLRAKVDDVFIEAGADIWTAFRQYWEHRPLVDGTVRGCPERYESGHVVRSVLQVVDGFRTQHALEMAIRAIVQADVAFFDLTRFEPGVMFLLGIRAATRRGVTVCSHGYGWREGQQLDTPFNLNDLQVFSHSESGEIGDVVVRRLIDATKTGFAQLHLQPRYLDLPAFDSLRELGSASASWGTIPIETLVLTLCSFRPQHLPSWRHVRRGLAHALIAKGMVKPRVERLIDLGSCQLVSQALYECIRRVAGCIVDWSLFSPSTFMEFGVRSAVSPWGAVAIIDRQYMPGSEGAARIRRIDDTPGPELRQVALMNALLTPRVYATKSADTFADVAETLMTRRPFDDEQPAYAWVHRIVRDTIQSISTAQPTVHDLLTQSAEGLQASGSSQDRKAQARALFAESQSIKQDHESAALERRIAAWLYLEHRVKARRLSAPEAALYRALGLEAAGALSGRDAPDDLALAKDILKTLRGSLEPITTTWQDEMELLHLATKTHRKLGERLRKDARHGEAAAEFRAGVAVLERMIDGLQAQPLWQQRARGRPTDDQLKIGRELVEAFGARGGLLRRLDESGAALESYRSGAKIEEEFVSDSTYNRVNAVKLALLSGASSLDALSGGIRDLADLLTDRLQVDQSLADNAWTWADLGDCRALLGDVPGAERAYRSFVAKAPTTAPRSTLDVLRQIVEKLEDGGDQKAGAVRTSLQALEARLT